MTISEQQAKQALDRYRKRIADGFFWLFAGVFTLFGLSTVYAAGGFLWKLIEMAAVVAVLWFVRLPATRMAFGPLLDGGRLVPAKITAGPDSAVGRLGAGFAFLIPLESLAGLLIPTRLVNYGFELDGKSYGFNTGAVYADEQISGQAEGEPMALVNPQNPGRNPWLVRLPK
jgi:hypothetical protein